MSNILKPLEIAVAWLMVTWHSLLTRIGFPEASGWTWALSIVGLVIVIRIILIPLFVKQIKASRGLQLVQPEIKKIQAKYKGKTDQESRQKMTQETMALYKDTGTNPFASCLPILLQAPIFFALFRVLNNIQKPGFSIGPLTNELREQADRATLFGSPISATFLNSNLMSTKILTIVLIVLMSASTFTTQRQLMMKNMPASALDNPFAQQQKVLLYVLPLVFAVSGVNFPIGVLLYWLTTNVWSMGQQFYVIRRMPAPGSPAEKALNDRRAKRGKPALPESNGVSLSKTAQAEEVVDDGPVPGQRIQPKKQPKRKRSGAKPSSRPTGPGSGPSSGPSSGSTRSKFTET
ncbi:MAG TPA: membrane protein insertase YidC [Kineosporiaceae bacterium]|nr:membrane protein insertase YidC [Kineosporiaceae bacterium]